MNDPHVQAFIADIDQYNAMLRDKEPLVSVPGGCLRVVICMADIGVAALALRFAPPAFHQELNETIEKRSNGLVPLDLPRHVREDMAQLHVASTKVIINELAERMVLGPEAAAGVRGERDELAQVIEECHRLIDVHLGLDPKTTAMETLPERLRKLFAGSHGAASVDGGGK